MSLLQNIKSELQKHSTLTILLIVNIALFFIINISFGIFSFPLYNYLALPLNSSLFLARFWTLFTYMFSHKDLGHVFYNMLLLYFTARTFLGFLSEKKLLFVYITSGLCGGVLLLLLSVIFPVQFSGSVLYGSSAAVLGVVTSLVMYAPNLKVSLFGLLEMKYKYYALLVFALTTIIDFNVNTGGKISHVGGALFGLLFGYLLKQGKDISVFSFFTRTKKPTLQVVHHNRSHTGTTHTSPNSSSQHTIDSLLDKISKIGYDNLTKEEKALLFKLSQKK